MISLPRSINSCGLGLVVAIAACGGDGALAGDGAVDTSEGTDPGAGTSGAPGDTDGPGGGGGGGGSTGGDGAGEPDVPDACVDVDCGQGACHVLDGTPACNCPDGQVDIGLKCVTCEAVTDRHDVVVTTAQVRGTIRINEAVPPSSQYEDGNVYLRNRGTGDSVLLGSTREGDFDVRVVAGRYDVVYVHEDGGTAVPVNSRAILQTVDVSDVQTISVEIPMVTLAGTFTIDGEVPPQSQYETGSIVLVDPAGGDEVVLGQTRDGNYVANVIPGVYEVHYRWAQGGDQVPRNGDAIVKLAEVKNYQGEVRPALDVDIQTVAASGFITINGSTPPTSEYDDGNLVLVDPQTQDEIPLANTREGGYSARLVAASYDVYYRAEDALGGGVPVNENAWLQTVHLGADLETDLDIPLVTAQGQFTLDGQSPPTSVYDSGVVTLEDQTHGDRAVLGSTHVGAFTVAVVAGEYDIVYGVTNTTGLMPANTRARVQPKVPFVGGGNTEVDIPTANVSGTVTLNGQPPPGTEYEDGRLYFRNVETGDRVLLGNTHDGAFSRLVVPDVYAVHYGLENGGADVPINGDEPVVTAVDVGATNQVDVAIGASMPAGATVVDGSPAPSSPDDAGTIVLRSLSTGDAFSLGSTHLGGFAEMVTHGTYIVEYHATSSGPITPDNEHASLSCIRIGR